MKKFFIAFGVLTVFCCTLAYAVTGQEFSVASAAKVAAREVANPNVGVSIGTVEAQLYSESGLNLNYFEDAQYVAQISEGTYMGFSVEEGNWIYDPETGEETYDESRFASFVAINSTEESVTIPDNIKIGDEVIPVTTICSYWKNLRNGFTENIKNLTVPSTIKSIDTDYQFDQYLEAIYMLGAAPQIWSNLNVGTVYVCNEECFSGYLNGLYDEHASILPYGWDFEWMTVNVNRKGEFAQTYIEMTDANWDLGIYVKITGALNSTDLQNIANLTNLMKLDLSNAEFTSMPQSFLSQKNRLTEVILPDYLPSISKYAFHYCTSLKKIAAPGVTSIGSDAFYGCINLSEFDLSKVQKIGEESFYNCSKFNPKDLSSIASVGSRAFFNTALSELIIPEGVTTIKSSAFSNCSRLQSVVLPNSITSIEQFAFSQCPSLASINFPEGMVSIGYCAFNNCSSLSEITLPSTLQSIEYDILGGCTSLETLKCKAIVPPASNGEFTYGIDLNHCTLYVAPFAIDAYRAAQDWSNFYIMKPLDEPVKNIYINRPITFDLMSEDNAVLQENPNMTLDYGNSSYNNSSVGQLSASGDGTLSAGIFSIFHSFGRRYNSSLTDYRTTLVNNAENMRADSVTCSISFEKNRWHFISFQYDVRMEDIFGMNNTDFVIREYNGLNRASGEGDTWENIPADGVLKAGKGYIIQAANNSMTEDGAFNPAVVVFPSRNTVTKNNLFTSNNVIVPLEEYQAEFAHNRSWNLVGNPYPCYYDMHYLMNDFSTPIILWRGTNYQAYSPIDDDIILRPNESFFVQRPLDAEEMVFGAEGRMHYDEANNPDILPGVYQARNLPRQYSDRSVFNFNLKGCETDDRARIVMNEDALMGYETNCDAVKFFSETAEGAEIYVLDNIKYSISERPLASGTAKLGMRIGTDGEYTISMTGKNINGWIVELIDSATGNKIKLNEEDYSFETKSGVFGDRFSLVFYAGGTTSIQQPEISTESANVKVANMSGMIVFEGDINDFKASAQPGIYVVTEGEKSYKIVIK